MTGGWQWPALCGKNMKCVPSGSQHLPSLASVLWPTLICQKKKKKQLGVKCQHSIQMLTKVQHLAYFLYLFNGNYGITRFVPGFVHCGKLEKTNREQWIQKHGAQIYLLFPHHCCCEHDSMSPQGFVDTNNRLTLVSLLSCFLHNQPEPATEDRGRI